MKIVGSVAEGLPQCFQLRRPWKRLAVRMCGCADARKVGRRPSPYNHGLTKGIILVPCLKLGATTGTTATMILNHVFKRFGLPDKIISDRGPQFASGMFRELMKHLGIQTSLSMAYHPQTDGTTERFNQEIEAYLSIYCTSHPEDWVDTLPMIEFTHNNR